MVRSVPYAVIDRCAVIVRGNRMAQEVHSAIPANHEQVSRLHPNAANAAVHRVGSFHEGRIATEAGKSAALIVRLPRFHKSQSLSGHMQRRWKM